MNNRLFVVFSTKNQRKKIANHEELRLWKEFNDAKKPDTHMHEMLDSTGKYKMASDGGGIDVGDTSNTKLTYLSGHFVEIDPAPVTIKGMGRQQGGKKGSKKGSKKRSKKGSKKGPKKGSKKRSKK
jgi:hypothetical protein